MSSYESCPISDPDLRPTELQTRNKRQKKRPSLSKKNASLAKRQNRDRERPQSNFEIHVRIKIREFTVELFSILNFEHRVLGLLLLQRLKTSFENTT